MNQVLKIVGLLLLKLMTGLLWVVGELLSTDGEEEKHERNMFTKSYRPEDLKSGEDVYRDEYGNYIEEDGTIDPYK